MAIILQQNNLPPLDHEMTAEEVAQDDAAYYASIKDDHWIDGYAILGIVIGVFLVAIMAKPLLFLMTHLIKYAVIIGLIYFMVVHYALR